MPELWHKAHPPGESSPLSTILALRRDPLGFLERTAARYGSGG